MTLRVPRVWCLCSAALHAKPPAAAPSADTVSTIGTDVYSMACGRGVAFKHLHVRCAGPGRQARGWRGGGVAGRPAAARQAQAAAQRQPGRLRQPPNGPQRVRLADACALCASTRLEWAMKERFA